MARILGTQVRDIRCSLGWSQARLAAVLCTSRQFVGQLEGLRRPFPAARRHLLEQLLAPPADSPSALDDPGA